MEKLRKVTPALILCAAMLYGGGLAAEQSTHHEGETADHAAQHHSYHPNMIGLFAGVTSGGRREGAPTLGIDYARRFNSLFSMGLVVEHAFADHPFWVYAVPFALHKNHWKFYAAPGVENSSEHGNQALVRLGVEYSFEVGRMEISPQLDVDIVEGDGVIVLGVLFGYGF